MKNKSCERGYKIKNGKCVKVRKGRSYVVENKKKRFWIFIGSVAGIIVGSWMIFYLKNNWGFLPAIIGFLSLIWGRK